MTRRPLMTAAVLTPHGWRPIRDAARARRHGTTQGSAALCMAISAAVGILLTVALYEGAAAVLVAMAEGAFR